MIDAGGLFEKAPPSRASTPNSSSRASKGSENIARQNKKVPPQFVKKAPKKDPHDIGVGAAKKVAARSVPQVLTDMGYKWLGPIAAGAFSTIVRAQHIASGDEVAVKTFDAQKIGSGKEAEERERELQVLRLVSRGDHAHIANLVEEHESPIGKHAMLFYCGGGSLHSHLAKFQKKGRAILEGDAAIITAQIGSALEFLHAMGVAHRDVKPANVLFDGEQWRLCDFGFAVECQNRTLKKGMGSMAYCAPEILANEGYKGMLVDMWAFGCMVYEMRIGRVAFIAPDLDTLKLRIKNGFKGGSEVQPWLPHISPACRALVSGLLKSDPEKRLTAGAVLSHAWVVTHCVAATDARPWWYAQNRWTCDLGGEGCVRTQSEAMSTTQVVCWAKGDEYMACDVCYRSGKVQHPDQLQMIEPVGNESPPGSARSQQSQGGAAQDEAAAEADAKARALNDELVQLKAKHNAPSRMEGLLMELQAFRTEAEQSRLELHEAKEQLAASQQRVLVLEMAAK